MLKVKKELLGEGEAAIAYKLDAGEGRYAVSDMPPAGVQGMLDESKSVEEKGEPGFEVCVDGCYFFPKSAFEEKGERPEARHAGAERKG